jgi:hypothetical protein
VVVETACGDLCGRTGASTKAVVQPPCRIAFRKCGRAKPSACNVVFVLIAFAPTAAHGRDGSSRVARSDSVVCDRHNPASTGRSGGFAVSAAMFPVEACVCCIAALRRPWMRVRVFPMSKTKVEGVGPASPAFAAIQRAIGARRGFVRSSARSRRRSDWRLPPASAIQEET